MKKIFSLFAAMALAMSVFAATETTVYYAIPASTVGTYTVKVNAHLGSYNTDPWTEPAVVMTLTGKTYSGNPIYVGHFTDQWDGVAELQFQLYDGNNFVSQEVAISSWMSASAYNGKMHVYSQDGWIDYAYDPEDPYVHLSANETNVFPGTEITLTSVADHFSGTISYAYSYSTDGENFTPIAGSGTSVNFTIGSPATYTFKVVASYNTEVANDECVVSVTTVKLAGTFNEWSTIATVMEDAANHESASVTIHLAAANNHLFQVVVGSTWKGNTGTMIRSDETIYNPGWVFEVGAYNNCTLNADMEGDYTFTFVYASNIVKVQYPNNTYTRTVTSQNWGTICLPYAATLENAIAYNVSSCDGNYVTLSEVGTSLVAGTPYIIKPSGSDVTITATYTGNKAESPVGNNGLWGNLSTTPIVVAPNEGNYILEGGKFHLVQGGDVTVPQYRAAYYCATSAPELRIIENATNIESIEANETAVKFIENGQLFIKKNGVVYDATGREVR